MSDSNPVRTLTIDIGGSGLKMFVLDEAGKPVTERSRHPTPQPATPKAVVKELKAMVAEQGEFDRISVGFPGVVDEGVIGTAANLHSDWVGFNLAKELEEASGKPTRVANDADVQGLAVIEGHGVELVLTLGTGMGSALFVDGRLVPNLELAHHPFRKGRTYEECVGNAARKDVGHDKWNDRVVDAIEKLHKLFNYRTIYLGGGNAKKLDFKLPDNVKIVPNVAGLLGGIALWRQ